jgi:hypothetical protein
MLRYRGEAPPIPIVVPHGKKASEPSIYIHIIPISTSQMQHVQRQVDKTRENRSSTVRKVNSTSMFSATTNSIVSFALLLALAIVACVFWLEKRSENSMAKARAYSAVENMENAQCTQSDDTILQAENFRTRGKLLLPSTTLNNPTNSGELTASSTTRGRSAGLLSRYGATHQ